MKRGFRYYVKLGAWGLDEPHEKTFEHLEDCEKDAKEQGYTRDMIGIDYCEEDDDGCVKVILNIIEPKGTIWDEGFEYDEKST